MVTLFKNHPNTNEFIQEKEKSEFFSGPDIYYLRITVVFIRLWILKFRSIIGLNCHKIFNKSRYHKTVVFGKKRPASLGVLWNLCLF